MGRRDKKGRIISQRLSDFGKRKILDNVSLSSGEFQYDPAI